MKQLAVGLWFEKGAEDAAQFYMNLFSNSRLGWTSHYTQEGAKVSGQKEGSVLVSQVFIDGLEIQALNGGPIFKFNQSSSFFVACKDREEIETLWRKLSEGGTVRMPLQKYDWAELYGWTTDRFGMEWQLSISDRAQKLAPSLLFTEKLFGKGEEAVRFYTSVFPNSGINELVKDEKTKTVMYSSFKLNGLEFALMEGAGKHNAEFNESFSIVVPCESQKEIDKYWDKLIADGGKASQCGWLKDRFGVSWQVVPEGLDELMSYPKVADKVFAEMLTMQKLDWKRLQEAARH